MPESLRAVVRLCLLLACAVMARGPAVAQDLVPDLDQADLPALISADEISYDETLKIISASGNVEIAPVGITHQGLSINSVTPGPGAGDGAGGAVGGRWTGLDTIGREGRSATRLLDLLRALDRLMVPDGVIIIGRTLPRRSAPSSTM